METVDPFEKQHQKVLLLIPHQDDEICMLSMLHRHLVNEDTVKVVWAAVDGHAKLADIRKLESQKAMQAVGVAKERLAFLDFPQLFLYEHIADLVNTFSEIMRNFQPDIIYCPSYEGGHLDHDTVHYCTVQAAAKGVASVVVLEFPLYNNNEKQGLMKRIPRFGRFLAGDVDPYVYLLSRVEIQRRKQWWRLYKSQTWLFNLLIFLSGSGSEFWSKEQVRRIPSNDYTRPPHSGVLNYECNFPQHFTDFRAAVMKYEESL